MTVRDGQDTRSRLRSPEVVRQLAQLDELSRQLEMCTRTNMRFPMSRIASEFREVAGDLFVGSRQRGVDFRGYDLRDLDMRAADFAGSQFDGAQIDGARFEFARVPKAELAKAVDWARYCRTWKPAGDDRLFSVNAGQVFMTTPLTADMVVLPSSVLEHTREVNLTEAEADLISAERLAVAFAPVTGAEALGIGHAAGDGAPARFNVREARLYRTDARVRCGLDLRFPSVNLVGFLAGIEDGPCLPRDGEILAREPASGLIVYVTMENGRARSHRAPGARDDPAFSGAAMLLPILEIAEEA